MAASHYSEAVPKAPRSGLTVTALQASAILAAMQAAGADATAVIAKVGLSEADFGDPSARLPRETVIELWYAALEVTGDEAFSLRMVELLKPGSFDLLDYLARSSATLGDSLLRAGKYARLFDDVAEIAVETSEDDVTISPRLAYDLPIPPGVMEAVLAVIVRIARETTGTHVRPRKVEFTHASPRDPSPYRKLFDCEVRFGAERNALVLGKGELALPLITADPVLSAILDRHAQEVIAKLPKADSFAQRVRGLLASELRGGDPSLERVATRLHMSARTLRRRLESENTSLQAILDQLRSELADRYLTEQKMTLDEVAFELGFADVRAFRRAFKRWTGRSPRQSA
jgi:AraC-like DNA-binding protein